MSGAIAQSTVAAPRAPLRWRVAAWLATAAAVGALTLVGVHWGWRWFGPTPATVPAPAMPARLAPAIVATPLFGRANAPAATAPDTASVQPAAAQLQGDTRLLGVLAQRNGGGYALFRLGDRGPVLVAAGNNIAEDVTLVSVQVDGVRVRDRGVERELLLRAAAPRSAAAMAAAPARVAAASGGVRTGCGAPAGFKGPVYRLNAELLTGIASQPDSWTALLAPVAGGLAIRDQSGFASMLGMKPGDRIAQANGIALSGVNEVLVAFVKPLIANQAVHVVGLRDGKRAEWLFLNAGTCP
jgi:hypothetical protein